ncbi:MAG: ABC transporter ATP-binding protein [Xanthomonadaceae bacterium]|nr:ABC transporter ATP-binding protein [Xanthomonadaceae bacterium]
MDTPLLELRDIECRYDDGPVVHGLSLHLRAGTIACLLGPSGCGKTTVLRAIAGFEPIQAGEIRLRGKQVSAPGMTVAPERRRIGMVFQEYALFPHMTVRQNIAFGLRGVTRDARRARVDELLALTDLMPCAERWPHELSGGQQQRVALARALAPRPELVLLDEPFSNLDVGLRERLTVEVREILQSQDATAVVVTHDQHEAFAIGDQVGVMHDGRIVQWDTPYNLYHEPVDRFVADFIGQGRFLPGRLLDPERLATEAGEIRGNRAFVWPAGTEVDVLLRPDDIIPDPDGPLGACITHKAFKGAEILYTLRLDAGPSLLSLFPSHLNHEVGERVQVRIDAEHLVAFPRTEA